MMNLLREELGLLLGIVTTVLFLTFGDQWLADLSAGATSAAFFLWLFAVMLFCAFGVVKHADCLAELLGEPYGTLILTIAVISIEVSLMAAIMLTGEAAPTLARDTMMAVIMIVLNLMIGMSLLLGGLRHMEQEFNLQGARSFLAVIIPLATMALILPRFTTSTADPTLSPVQEVMFATITILLYGTFLTLQTVRHKSFFVQPGLKAEDDDHGHEVRPRSVPYHAVLLVLTMLPIVLLSKKLAVLIDFGIATMGAPVAIGGILIAILVLTPEGLAAFKGALSDRLQRSVNICLGSALATIGLTVPAVIVIDLLTGTEIVLGLEPVDMVLLILTLLLSSLTFGGARTNMLQGVVHLVVFVVYVVLIFSP